jgi:two-component system response regulator FlrC
MKKTTPLNATILVVEDDKQLREALTDTLELAGCTVLQADSGEAAIDVLVTEMADMVISDINMGGMDGIALLKILRQRHPQLPVLLITAYGSISASVDAMRSGAVDYLVKPFRPDLLVQTVARYVGQVGSESRDDPVAYSVAAKQVFQLALRVAATDSTIMIGGESGTGKEVLARYIHRNSPRANKPFIAINCAAIPENMLEAMLFGYEKGAFTGAHQSMPGKFEQANGGTLLLDEITEMDLGLQAKLLRVLQEREVERLGARKAIPLDVRIIATSNRKLQQYVREGKLREDLYYRLSVFPLQWLPLRSRREDILPLARHLAERHCEKMGAPMVTFARDAELELLSHNWPGNVRELDNVIQRALILHSGNEIVAADLHIDPWGATPIGAQRKSNPLLDNDVEEDDELDLDDVDTSALGDDLQQREFKIIMNTLSKEGGSRKATAERLGISPRTLRYKLARMRDMGVAVGE